MTRIPTSHSHPSSPFLPRSAGEMSRRDRGGPPACIQRHNMRPYRSHVRLKCLANRQRQRRNLLPMSQPQKPEHHSRITIHRRTASSKSEQNRTTSNKSERSEHLLPRRTPRLHLAAKPEPTRKNLKKAENPERPQTHDLQQNMGDPRRGSCFPPDRKKFSENLKLANLHRLKQAVPSAQPRKSPTYGGFR